MEVTPSILLAAYATATWHRDHVIAVAWPAFQRDELRR
jgi:hypothetical protein